MARRFESARRGVTATLDDDERALLGGLLAEVSELLDDGSVPSTDPLEALVGAGGPTTPPADPAVARLLPQGAKDDPDAAREFRRLTEKGLRARKRETLERARATLERPGALVLDAEEAHAWLVSLTDVRLVLAERLGLRTDEDADAVLAEAATSTPEDPRVWMASVYDFLTWLQESLVAALMERQGRR
ncbi:protein of unknown function [Quadrisphaera granulorum]|uniref:Uncharacterized protein DUF2017 n=1 Tax=Quadrisphaera granulorum TaxID=317664 RepID=A0A316ABU8_9ACTN|nr:DUF2017 domain-containing protein [Quadrisphaera granulorum]PWJ54889.1 uncharacterized protein DUF2017 [Quadrisphaera granulorum]SZE95835.1 protein of unknown function [Quadrisphaera granulorum]